jgi:hypothetical protein
MRTGTRSLLVVALLAAIGCIGAWFLAYSPEPCYRALYGRSDEFPPYFCDFRLGMTFVFRRDSPLNIVAVLGWAIPYVITVWIVSLSLFRKLGVLGSTLFATTASAVLWLLLIWSLDRAPYLCAFGFGGSSCSGFLSNLGFNIVFLGWVIPVASLLGIPIISKMQRGEDA